MPQGITDFWDNNTVVIVAALIGAVATVTLQMTTGAVGKAVGWLWGKRPFRKQPSLSRDPTLTIEETFDRQLEALQQRLDSALTDDEKAPIRLEMGRVAEEKAGYYRASRELSLPEDIRDRMEALANRQGTIAEARIPQELPRDPEVLAQLYQRMRQDLLQEVAGFREYNQAVEQHPDDAEALAARATGLSLSGRYEEALADYNRSLELRPDAPDTLNNPGPHPVPFGALRGGSGRLQPLPGTVPRCT
jgi:tetratricopeptide (TPR) repeat protein